MADSYVDLTVEQQGPVAIVTIARPAVLNALAINTLEELHRAFSALAVARDTRVVVLTGAGPKAFVAGADIREFLDLAPEPMWRMMRLGHRVFDLIAACPKVVIGAINGFALGGGLEVALACDILIAASNAQFGHPEINLGSFPGWGGTQRLPRRIGLHRAKELVFSGERITAERAEALGLVNRVVAPERLMAEVLALANLIATKSGAALEMAKEVLNASIDTPLHDGQALEAFAVSLGSVFADRKEGVQAFLERRPPQFNQG